VLVALFGGTLGWTVAQISRSEGLSSTVTSRFYGFGARGSVIASAIFGFMILGFLALENALLYYGTLFAFGWHDTLALRIVIFGVLTIGWIVLTTFGVNLVLRVASYLMVAFLILVAYMFYRSGFASGVAFLTVMTHGPLIPGLGGTWARFSDALVTLAGSAGALALVDADYARYARSAKDVVIMAYAGSFMMDVVTMIAGAVIVYGGMGPAIHYVIGHHMASPAQAVAAVNALAQNNTGAFFIILSAAIGFILMYAAQIKAQVLNTYSGSLALTNLFDALGKWRPGRFAMVILGNVIALLMIAGGILDLISSWLNILGVITTAFAGVMIADYYLVRKQQLADHAQVESVNVAGVVSIGMAVVLAVVLESAHIFALGFLTALVVAVIAYPLLRTKVFKPGTLTGMVDATLATQEAEG
jgi:cytosine permease